MATNFPTSVDNFTNPTANDSLNAPSHSVQHANANDAIEAIEGYLLNTYQPTFRNAIINGDFRVWQRGTSFSNPSTNTYTADRWVVQHDGSGATRTISQQAFTPGNPISGQEPQYYLRYAVSAAGTSNTYNLFLQKIEDVRTFAGQTVTVSFWAKADATRTVAFDVEQGFGSGGSGQLNTNFGSVSLTTSWVRYSLTVTVPSISGKTIGTNSYMGIRWQLPSNTTQTIDIWGVQLERGTVATPFEQRPIGTELALCQRYYQTYSDTNFYGSIARSGVKQFSWVWQPQMRTSPTVTVSSITLANSTAKGFTGYFSQVDTSELYILGPVGSAEI